METKFPRIVEIETIRKEIARLRNNTDSEIMDWLTNLVSTGKIDEASFVTEQINKMGRTFYSAAVKNPGQIFGNFINDPDIVMLITILRNKRRQISESYQQAKTFIATCKKNRSGKTIEEKSNNIREQVAATTDVMVRQKEADQIQTVYQPLIIRQDDDLKTLLTQYQIRSIILLNTLKSPDLSNAEKVGAVAAYRRNLSQAISRLEPSIAVKKAIEWLEFLTNTPSGVTLLMKCDKEDLIDISNPLMVIAMYLSSVAQGGRRDAREETFCSIMSKANADETQSNVSEQKLAGLFSNIDSLGIDEQLAAQMKRNIVRDLITFELRSIKNDRFEGTAINPITHAPPIRLSQDILDDERRRDEYDFCMSNDESYFENLSEKLKPRQLLQTLSANFCHTEIFEDLPPNLEVLFNALAQADQDLYHRILAEIIEALAEKSSSRDSILKGGTLPNSEENFNETIITIANELGLASGQKYLIKPILNQVQKLLKAENLQSRELPAILAKTDVTPEDNAETIKPADDFSAAEQTPETTTGELTDEDFDFYGNDNEPDIDFDDQEDQYIDAEYERDSGSNDQDDEDD